MGAFKIVKYNKANKLMVKIYLLTLALYPIISGYGLSPQLDFGVLSVFAVGVLLALKIGRFKPKLPTGYMLFLIVALAFSIFFAQTIPLRLILYTINLSIACYFVDFKLLNKYYGSIVIFSCVFFLIQEFYAFLFGSNISGILSFIPTIYEGLGIDIASAKENAERHSSFFLEPSYFVQFLFPYIVFKLCSTRKTDTWLAIIVSIVILLSRSGNGVVLLLIIWGCWFFMVEKINFKFKIISVIVISIMIILIIRFNDSIYNNILLRSAELLSYGGDERFQSSGFIRFFRGYYAYADIPDINKLFGANPELVWSVVGSNYFFSSSEDRFLNGAQTLLLHHGLFVTILFFRHILFFYWYNKKPETFIIVLCCIWLMLGESYFLCSRMFLTTVLVYSMKRRNTISFRHD